MNLIEVDRHDDVGVAIAHTTETDPRNGEAGVSESSKFHDDDVRRKAVRALNMILAEASITHSYLH
jgi:hypothetical protein